MEVVLAHAEAGRETNDCCRQDAHGDEQPYQGALLLGPGRCRRRRCSSARAGISVVVLSMLRCGVVGVVILLGVMMTLGVDIPGRLLLRRLVVL